MSTPQQRFNNLCCLQLAKIDVIGIIHSTYDLEHCPPPFSENETIHGSNLLKEVYRAYTQQPEAVPTIKEVYEKIIKGRYEEIREGKGNY